MAGAVWSSLLAELTTWVLEMKRWKSSLPVAAAGVALFSLGAARVGPGACNSGKKPSWTAQAPARPLTRAALFAARVAARSSTRQAPNHCPSHHLLADAAFPHLPERRGRRRSNDMGHTNPASQAHPQGSVCANLCATALPLFLFGLRDCWYGVE